LVILEKYRQRTVLQKPFRKQELEEALSKARGGLPAPGFFDRARRLGRFAGDEAGLEAWAFHAREFNAAVSFWIATATTGKIG